MEKKMTFDPTAYPEHEKRSKVSTESIIILRFLEWLQGEETEYVIGYWETDNELLIPEKRLRPLLEFKDGEVGYNLMCEYLDLDPRKLAQETRHMLKEIQKIAKKRGIS
jgi:hypothetical protein